MVKSQQFHISEDFAKIILFFPLVHAQSRDSDQKQPLSAIVTFYKFSEMEEEKLVRKYQDLSQLFDFGSNTFR